MKHLTAFALRLPKTTIAIAVVLAGLGAWSASSAPATSGAHALIGESHADIRNLEEFLREFGSGYPVIVAWSCESPGDPCDSIFDDNSLRMAHEVGLALATSPNVSRVSSPAKTAVLLAADDGFVVHRFVEDGIVNAPREAIAAAQADPFWDRTLLGKGAHVGALIVESERTGPADQAGLVADIEKAIEPWVHSGFHFYLSGNPMFHVVSQREAVAEAALIGAATGCAIAVCFLFLIQSWQSVVGVLISIGLATGFGLGAIAIFGWSWDPLTSAAPTLILVMGSADAIHYLTSYWRMRSNGLDLAESLTNATQETWVPCTMTTATSVAGLLSFVGTESVGFAHFGVTTALGVLAALALTFTVLPSILVLLPDGRTFAIRESERWDRIVARLIEFPISRSRAVLGWSMGAAAIGAFGLTQLTTDAHPLHYWRDGHPTREGIEYVSQHLASIEGVEVRVALDGTFEGSAEFERLLKFERDLAGIPDVRGTLSVLTLLDRCAHVLGAGELNHQNAGEILALVSLSDASVIDQWISVDHRTIRFSLSAESLGVDARERLLARVAAAVHELPQDWEILITGPSALQRSIDQVVSSSALQAFSWTSLVVWALVALFLRSFGWGVLAMIPNLLPMVVLFGLMGFFGIALDAGTALVAPIAVGIAADDTIHFLHAFTAERRRGVGLVEATRSSGRHVGRAIVTTSGTLAIGFLAMLVSRFQSMANIGLLSAASIVAAFAAELLVLPALISAWSSWRSPSA